jgi:hypothetical protein
MEPISGRVEGRSWPITSLPQLGLCPQLVEPDTTVQTGSAEIDHKRHSASFRLDPELLDDRPPFFCIGFLQGAECLWRLLFARENILAEIG